VWFSLTTFDWALDSFPYSNLGSWTDFGEHSANFIFPGDRAAATVPRRNVAEFDLVHKGCGGSPAKSLKT
jgi:hypothetical protein